MYKYYCVEIKTKKEKKVMKIKKVIRKKKEREKQ